MFRPVSPKVDFAKLEEEILRFWKKNKIFEKSLAKDSPKGNWTFLDGPPFVTGLPHYGHLLTSIAKDLFPRFKTMQGYHVRRVWGWDGHGLPVENKVENKLEIKRKRDIEEVIGVKKFIEECKKYVEQVSDEWEWYVDHIARWVDFKNAYKTWDTPYMESVMWVFRQLYEKDLIYKGLRVSLYCPHCSTPISNFEVAMDADNYRDVNDPMTTYKYPIKGEEKTFILAWSTTPWNKIVTPALAVNPKLTYVKVKQNNENYILAKSTLKVLGSSSHPKPFDSAWRKLREGSPEKAKRDSSARPQNDNGNNYEILEEFKGTELIGKKFVPHYDYYPIASGEKAFEIVGGDFVTAEEGTGVVTIAAYGEEDIKAMQEYNIHVEMHLDEEGTVKPDVPKFGGMYYLKANKAVNQDLAERGLIYKDEILPHSVPHCWRCHTRLYYAPIDAWFINVQKLKEQMIATNEKVNWVPKHFKHGRFLKSLENAPDWNISRNRYWGSPVPVWECECGQRFVPGSIKELEERSGKKITDLHKPEIDEVLIVCKACGKNVARVPEVLDSWIEAGSASFGERHYPFGKLRAGRLEVEELEDFYPPDFIVEYTGQIRAWFYVLHVIANALYQVEAFKNVLVNGVILGTDGRKMSKNFGNYPDPKEMLERYGGDALRLYLMSSPVVQGEDTAISEEQYRNQVKGTMLVLWNVYNFFITYANIDKFQIKESGKEVSENVLDKWILSLLNKQVMEETKDLENYDTIKAVGKIRAFVDDLSTWYIRRSRDRVGPSTEDSEDKSAFYATSYEVLVTLSKLLAPITPFLAEEIYKNLTGEESVHLSDWPTPVKDLIDKKLEEEMQYARKAVELAHAKRKEAGIKVRQPLLLLTITTPVSLSVGAIGVIRDEVNVENVEQKKGEEVTVVLDTKLDNELLAKGQVRDIIRKIQEERKKLGTALDEEVNVVLDKDWPKEFEEEIKKKALIKRLEKGERFSLRRV